MFRQICNYRLPVFFGGVSSNDAQIADTTVSMIAYILLSFRYRYDNYESMGALFRSMNADRLRQTLDIRLAYIIIRTVLILYFC
jgi:hypothetical protein